MAYTLISTGAFLDWGLDNGFLCFDIPTRTATLYDEGKHPVSGTILKNLGKAVVAILRHPELTMNQRICLSDVTFTQLEILALLEKYTDRQWTINHASTQDTLRQAEVEWKKGNLKDGYFAFIRALAYGGTGSCNFGHKAKNKELGLECVSLEQVVKDVVQRKQTTHQ